jgi:hypothetical protein
MPDSRAFSVEFMRGGVSLELESPTIPSRLKFDNPLSPHYWSEQQGAVFSLATFFLQPR